MKLNKDEYTIGRILKECHHDEIIIVTKTSLENWLSHYKEKEERQEDGSFMRGFFSGKSDIIQDLLEHFKPRDL